MVNPVETWNGIYASGRAVRRWPNEDVIRFCSRRLDPQRCLRSDFSCLVSSVTGARMKVLEAGCGNGANVAYLAAEDYHVVGVDCSSKALEQVDATVRARRHDALAWVTLRTGQLGSLLSGTIVRQSPGWLPPYDAVIDCRVSQHSAWSDHDAIYADYLSLLKPGGWFFLYHLDDQTQPDANQIDGITERYTWDNVKAGVYPDNGLTCMPPRDKLVRLVNEAGFLVREQEQVLRLTERTVCAHTVVHAQKPAVAV